ncbi:MAG: C40 family peptidase [Prevotellaceae bacterium]|jgi:cell wall-associated NlpC family hydrolase|nr:C40 family peptidase [Prevotellaceae bacterium]
MKNVILSLSLIAILYGCSQTSSTSKVAASQSPVESFDKFFQSVVDTVRQQFVPDRRVNIFDVKIKYADDKVTLKGVTTLAEAKTELLNRMQEFLNRILTANKNIVDSISLLPEQSLGDETFGVVTLSVASMRTSGEYSAEMATQALLGTPVKILQSGSWLRVQTPDGYISYTYAGNIKRMNKQQFNEWISSPKIIFTENYGFAYTAPNSSDAVSDMVAGNMLKLEDETEQYYKVSYPDGRIAYVDKKQSKKSDEWISSINLTGDNIADYGKRFMGVPYLWGGTSSKALDCSGFAKTVYFMHGVILQRDASQQCYTGQPIDLSDDFKNLKTGDLLFFGSKAQNGRKERIGHVAIYIGNKQFIHEATQVKINSLDPSAANYDRYNTNRLVRASRIIGNIDTKGITTVESNEFYQKQQ